MGILFSSTDPSTVEKLIERRHDRAACPPLRQGSNPLEKMEGEQFYPGTWRLNRQRSFSSENTDKKDKPVTSEPLSGQSRSPSKEVKGQDHDPTPSLPLIGECRPRKEPQMTFEEHIAMVSEQHAYRNRRMSREQIERRLSRGGNDSQSRSVRKNTPFLRQEQSSHNQSRRNTEPINDRSRQQMEPANCPSWFHKANKRPLARGD